MNTTTPPPTTNTSTSSTDSVEPPIVEVVEIEPDTDTIITTSTAPLSSDVMTPAKTIDSHLLSDLDLASQTLLFGLNFKRTEVDKRGLLNRFKKKKQSMDIDLSCILFDKYLEVVDTIWFKHLRDDSFAVRHHGDSLDGNDRNDEAQLNPNIDVETIEVRLKQLPDHINHIVFLVSAYHGYPINQLERGHIYLGDDEGNHFYDKDLTTIHGDTNALCVATLSRELGEWRVTLNNLVLDSNKMEAMRKQTQQELARFHNPTL